MEDKATGLLRLSWDNHVKQIYFKNGSPIFVDSNLRRENLGEILLREKKITAEQHAKVINYMLEHNMRQGEAIVSLGYFSGMEIYQFLEEQIREKIYNCFELEEFESSFNSGLEQIEDIMEFSLDPLMLLFTGVNQVYTAKRAREEWPINPEDVVLINPAKKDLLQKLKLNGTEVRITRAINGIDSVRLILKNNTQDSKKAFVFLFSLYQLDILQIGGGDIEDAVKVTKETSQAVKEAKPAKKAAIHKDSNSLENQICHLYLKVSYQNLFKVLDLPPHAGEFDIKNAYAAKVHKFHLNDIEKHYRGEVQKQAKAVFNRFTLAYTILSDKQRRKDYLDNQGRESSIKIKDEKLLAEVELHKAEILLETKHLKEAIVYYDQAIKYRPEEAYYLSRRAYCRIKILNELIKDKKSAEEEKQELAKLIQADLDLALRKDSKNFEACSKYGTFAKLCGEMELAKKMFRKSLEIKKDDQNIQTQLRFLEMQKDQDGKSPFSFKLK